MRVTMDSMSIWEAVGAEIKTVLVNTSIVGHWGVSEGMIVGIQ